ncbi:MAG: molybdopterin-dependent oxidoreductase [Planctomycetales bacterium]|jgi:sulfite oxidase
MPTQPRPGTNLINADSSNRREFLRDASLAGTGLAVAPWLAGFSSNANAAEQNSDNLIIHTTSPLNAEPKLDVLEKSWITPVESFYVRSHAPNPKIDPAAFRVTVEGLVDKPLSVSLAELNGSFEEISVLATMTCAGNRRSEHSLIKPVGGVPWQAGAIGNARWSGVRLSEVLKKAGLKEGAKHVWFEGLDEISKGGGIIPFGASIPVSKAMTDAEGMPGALLTTKMNDQPLTPDHGAPLRGVVPGYVGARSVKWLGKIVVSDRPSPNHYVATAYKLVQEGTPVEWAESGPIYRFPLNSVICTPPANSKTGTGKIAASGYAYPSGQPGTSIAKVEVSADEGRSWTVAKITSPIREHCWVLWKADVSLSSSASELIVRATDTRGDVQPEHARWNMKGYMFNGWYHVPIGAE